MECETKSADTFPAKSEGRGQHEVGPIRFQQIRRTNIGLKSARNQGHDVHESLGRLAAVLSEVPDLFQSEHVVGVRIVGLGHGRVPPRLHHKEKELLILTTGQGAVAAAQVSFFPQRDFRCKAGD
ncbi:MAG: hypothetical protein ABSB35_36140 [Bryobacteraceae bacterium]|jgi:hypothetical protein